MKNQVVLFILAGSSSIKLHKTKRSPFDVSKLLPGLIGVLAAITGL